MEDHRITASFTELRQSVWAAKDFLVGAKDTVDNVFGDGYASKHPDLVAAVLKATSDFFATSFWHSCAGGRGETPRGN